MRTNIEIDDQIMRQAMEAGGFKTKKETVEAALKLFTRQKHAYRKLLNLRGSVDWDPGYGYKAMRAGRFQGDK
jgi:antitoxin ParD1/3/4